MYFIIFVIIYCLEVLVGLYLRGGDYSKGMIYVVSLYCVY